MSDLKVFSDWLLSSCSTIANVVFSQWGFVGAALFCFPILRKLIKIFRNTF